jgi:hypothetical protein
MNSRVKHRVPGDPDKKGGGRVFNEVPVKIELALDIVVCGGGKPGRQSPQKQRQLVARREIRGVDRSDIHGQTSQPGRR